MDWRMKGTLAGLALIVYGVISAIWMYLQDASSFDLISMLLAPDAAILHGMLWSLAGLGVILYYQLAPNRKRD